MFSFLKRALRRRQRASGRCAACGDGSSLQDPLMFVAETNRYWHYPRCMPVDRIAATQAETDAVARRT